MYRPRFICETLKYFTYSEETQSFETRAVGGLLTAPSDTGCFLELVLVSPSLVSERLLNAFLTDLVEATWARAGLGAKPEPPRGHGPRRTRPGPTCPQHRAGSTCRNHPPVVLAFLLTSLHSEASAGLSEPQALVGGRRRWAGHRRTSLPAVEGVPSVRLRTQVPGRE